MKDFHRNLDRILRSYRRIKSKQHTIRLDINKLHDIENRTKHLEKRISHLKRLEDTESIAKEAKKIIHDERKYLNDMEERVKNTIRWAREQQKSIRRIRKKL